MEAVNCNSVNMNGWQEKPDEPSDKKMSDGSEFYKKAQKYWAEVPATINGMLGGLGYIHAIDIQGSKSFLRDLHLQKHNRALDCGAGIGRVTKNLLMSSFNVVDMVEQDGTFATKAREYCSTDSGSALGYPNRLGEIFNVGLQDFVPSDGTYDLIWSQWVLGHLTTTDLVKFFRRIKNGLADGGYFIMKENVTKSPVIEKDDNDSSVIRPLKDYETILKDAGFRIVRVVRQQGFPKGLYPVFMIACKP